MTTTDGKPRVLFLCTGNSCRSQMAEGFARDRHGSWLEAASAGTRPQSLNPLAVRAMAELGIDISAGTSKTPEACDPATLDLVVTVCGHAHETCPVFAGPAPGEPGARVLHRGFDDPPRLAARAATDEQALPHDRRVRDQIRAFIEHELPGLLGEPGFAASAP